MFELPSDELLSDLEDQEFAHGYLSEQGNMRIAAQVRALRIARKWTQRELADASGMAQERISKIESGDFDSLTLHTLRKLAFAFDVHLTVAFTRVSSALIDLNNLTRDRLVIPKRQDDLEAFDHTNASTYFSIGAVSGSSVQSPISIVPNRDVNSVYETNERREYAD